MVAFDVVIATRNRPEALELSLPYLLAQSVQPSSLVVVDASDDHQPTRAAVQAATATYGGKLIIEQAAAGLTHQRTVGLSHVTAPVVMFPDDDSVFWPGALEAMQRVYERDSAGAIAGVCATEVVGFPSGRVDVGWEISETHVKERVRLQRRRTIERGFGALNPFLSLGRALQSPLPDWADGSHVVPVEWMTGFRMSFRTDAIRAASFEQRFKGYSVFEDVDASFGAMRHGAVVAALDAKIYHHRFPGGRPDRRALSTMSMVNRAYVVAKHATAERLGRKRAQEIRSQMRAYAALRVMALTARAGSSDGRADLRGTVAALPSVHALLRSDPRDLGRLYEDIRDRLSLH